MNNPLNINASSLISAGKPTLSGAGKPDHTEAAILSEKFAGHLHQAFQETKAATKPTHKAKSEYVEAPAAHASNEKKLNAKRDKTTEKSSADKKDPATTKQTEALTTENETSETASAEAHPTEEPSAENAEQESTPISAQDLLALVLPVEPQPLNLAVLQAATPFISQQPQPAEASEQAPDASTETTAITTVGLAPTTTQLALMSDLKIQQDVPGLGDAASTPAELQDKEGQSEASLQDAAQTVSDTTETLTTPQQELSKPSPLPLSLPASSEGLVVNGDLALQAITPLEGLGAGKASKPNATLPATDAFKKSLDSIQAHLSELNGEIESDSRAAQEDFVEPALADSATSADASTLSASDLLTATGLNGSGQSNATASGLGNDTGVSGIAQFSSSAQNPTDQVAEGTAYSVKNGNRELIIRLNPDNLGEVRINLTSHGNQQLSARLIASTTESHDLLKSQLDHLKNTLTAQGINVDRLSIVLAGSTESGNANNQSNPDQPAQQKSQHDSSNQGGSFQQQFNQQNPANAGLFNHMNGQSHQHQSGFAHNQAQNRLGNALDGVEAGLDGVNSATPSASTKHDNGSISILA